MPKNKTKTKAKTQIESGSGLEKLLILKLKELLDAEKEIIKALPKMVKKAGDPALRKGLEEHLKQTKDHIKRLEKAFKLLGSPARANKGEAIRGLAADAEQAMKSIKNAEVLDAALIAAAQSVEHYEIAGYGTATDWADLLGQHDVADLMEQTLEEEYQADENLTKIAISKANLKALG